MRDSLIDEIEEHFLNEEMEPLFNKDFQYEVDTQGEHLSNDHRGESNA